MHDKIKTIRVGLFLVMLNLLFGISLGVGFGVKENSFKAYVATGIKNNPQLHDEKSQSKIWRYGQRAHFHAIGLAAFSIGLVLLTMFSSLTSKLKSWCSILIGLGGLYPLAWLTMYLLAPSIGRDAAHHHLLTEFLTYVGVLGLLAGFFLLSANLFFGCFSEEATE
ncbi:MAG: hypothetical protein GQ569_02395 [Methylococcaceae bacterium]|nr:hypothetical protein [Methylococcaceae bacterium]